MASNLWTLVEPSVIKHGKYPAWICRQKGGHRIVTYDDLHRGVQGVAHSLRSLGVTHGDTVGITAPNGPEWTAAAFAAWKLGANIAPIHIGNSDHEIAMQLQAVTPKIMLYSDTDIEYPDKLEISLDCNDEIVSNEQGMAVPGDPEDVAVRIYTSGSTGQPKVVRLSHSNHASNVLAACNLENFTTKDRFISLLPFSHAMGLTANLLLPVYRGCAVVSPKVLAAAEILDALSEEKVSVVIAVPRLYRNVMLGMEKKFAQASKGLQLYLKLLRGSPLFLRKILNAPLRKKFGGHIKIWVSGGSHLDSKVTDYYHALGFPLRQGYGLTETSPLTSIQDEFDAAKESVGKPIEKVLVKIHEADDEGKGEVWIKGPNVMLGYEDADQNATALEDGWFKTGDIGKLDSEGRITLTGRSKRLIVTEAGKNVYPEELETLLERDSRIKEAGVFELDMKPVCVLAVDGDDPKTLADTVIREFNQLVSSHNHITRFAVTDELPRTPLGKMALQQLPEVFEANEVK